MRDLLERTDISGKTITLDAAHTTRRTAQLITETADCVFVIKGNSPKTSELLNSVDWEQDAVRGFTEKSVKARGRLEQRSISVMTPKKGLINYPGVSQTARITRCREPLKKDPDDGGKSSRDYTETAYIITSLDAGQASPERLLQLNRRHWAVENMNHRQRDCFFDEDACLTRKDCGPANRASLNNIALALIFVNRRGTENLAETRRRLQLDHSQAFAAVTEP